MEQTPLNQHAEQNLLGFLEESPDNFAPVYKMQKFNSEKLLNNIKKLGNKDKSSQSNKHNKQIVIYRNKSQKSSTRKEVDKPVISEESKKLSLSDILKKPVVISVDSEKLLQSANNTKKEEDTKKSSPLKNDQTSVFRKKSPTRKEANKVIADDSRKFSLSDILNKPVVIPEDLEKLFQSKQLNKPIVTSEDSEKLSLSSKANNRVIIYKNSEISNRPVVKQINKKTLKTLVLTKDKQSGDSFFVINDKRVPIKKIQIVQENIKNMCVDKSTNELKRVEQKIKVVSVGPNMDPNLSESVIQNISSPPNNRGDRNMHKYFDKNTKVQKRPFYKKNLEADCDAQKQILEHVVVSDSDEVEVKTSKRTGDSMKVRSVRSELDLLNFEEEKVQRKVRRSFSSCNSTILKHKTGLLEIIQKLCVNNSYLKRALLIARRKLALMKIDNGELEVEVKRRDEEVQWLQKIIADFKSESGDHRAELNNNKNQSAIGCTEPDTKQNCEVDLINLRAELNNENDYEISSRTDSTETSSSEEQQENNQVLEEICTETLDKMKIENNCVNVNYVDIKSNVTVVEDNVGENPCLYLHSLYNPNMKQIGDGILIRDINMGVNLDVPKVIAVDSGHGIQMFNGNLQMNKNSKMMLWICYKMCDKQDEYGDCPIHIAVSKNDVNGVRRQCQALRMRKLSVDIENSDGFTPLQLAVLNKVSTSIVQILKSFDADFADIDNSGNNIFHIAAENQYLKELYKNNLIDNTDSNAINAFNYYPGYTPLMVAIKNKNYEDAKVLIDLKADINLQDKTTGKTALFHAVESNSLDLVDLLMANGAETWRKNFSGHRLQDTINELDVSPSLKKLFSDMEEASAESTRLKRIKQHGPLKFVSKKMKI